jgi:NTE family protein
VERLRRFWQEAAQHDGWASPRTRWARRRYGLAHVLTALTWGNPPVFRPRLPGLWSILPWMPGDVALYDHGTLRGALERLIDFDRLNRAETALVFVCVDVETGEEVWFDNRRERIGPEHLLASSALAPLFPPVEIGGRLLADPGYVNNLPIDHLLIEPPECDLLCFAVELFSSRGPRPTTLDATLERVQDILFASHGRRTVEALRRERGLMRRLDPRTPSLALVHLAYHSTGREQGAKTLDFSAASIRDRQAAGRHAMASALARLAAARLPLPDQAFSYLAVDPHDEDAHERDINLAQNRSFA